MEISGFNQARPDWYDRNPTTQQLAVRQLAIAPHADTVRVTYTVPTGKKAFLASLWTQILRETAAAPAGRCFARWTRDTNTILDLNMLKNAIADSVEAPMPVGNALLAGQVLEGQDGDASTGGTVTFSYAAHLLEFDA